MSKIKPVVEGYVRHRFGKKWKRRYCLLSRATRGSDCLQIYILKDYDELRASNQVSRTSVSTGSSSSANDSSVCSASASGGLLPLDDILGFESGCHVDRESCVIALVGRQSVQCVALNNMDEMFRWAVVLSENLTGSQFRVTLISVGEGSRLHPGTQGSLHVHPTALSLVSEPGQGSKLICAWRMADLESHTADQDRVTISAGRTAGKLRGTHHFEVDAGKADQLGAALEAARTRSSPDLTNGSAKSPSPPSDDQVAGTEIDIVRRSSEIQIPGSRRNSSQSTSPLHTASLPTLSAPLPDTKTQLIFDADEDLQRVSLQAPSSICGMEAGSESSSPSSPAQRALPLATVEGIQQIPRSNSLHLHQQSSWGGFTERKKLLQRLFHKNRSRSQDDAGLAQRNMAGVGSPDLTSEGEQDVSRAIMDQSTSSSLSPIREVGVKMTRSFEEPIREARGSRDQFPMATNERARKTSHTEVSCLDLPWSRLRTSLPGPEEVRMTASGPPFVQGDVTDASPPGNVPVVMRRSLEGPTSRQTLTQIPDRAALGHSAYANLVVPSGPQRNYVNLPVQPRQSYRTSSVSSTSSNTYMNLDLRPEAAQSSYYNIDCRPDTSSKRFSAVSTSSNNYMNLGPDIANLQSSELPAEVMDPSKNYAMVDLRPTSADGAMRTRSAENTLRHSCMDYSLRPSIADVHQTRPRVTSCYVQESPTSVSPTPPNLNYVHVVCGGSLAPTSPLTAMTSSNDLGLASGPCENTSPSVNYAAIDFERTVALSELTEDLDALSDSASLCSGQGSKSSRTASVRKSLSKSFRSIGKKKSDSVSS